MNKFFLKLYKASEIESLLNKYGFKVLKRLIPYSNNKAQENTEIILYECVNHPSLKEGA